MDDVARVVLAMTAPEVAEEVLHFLDRSGRARVVATAEDAAQCAAAVAQLEPDAVVAEPQLVREGAGVPVLALAPRETVASLRAAVSAGARGFYLWPAERDGLLEGVDGVRAAAGRVLARRATVVAVHAARGGAGCTFVATHLAQALAHRGASCVLVELDRDYADLTHALGADGEELRTIADLVPVADELTTAHVDDVLHRGTILGPPAEAAETVTDELLRRVVEVAASNADAVVLHVPRALSPITRWAFEAADRALHVVTLDVLAFRATTRAVDRLPASAERAIVVNRAARAEITPADVRRVFGVEPLAVIPADAAVPRAQDHGRLLPTKGRIGRAFDRLAAAIVVPATDEAA
jgi:pilus assembly protein CpaE